MTLRHRIQAVAITVPRWGKRMCAFYRDDEGDYQRRCRRKGESSHGTVQR